MSTRIYRVISGHGDRLVRASTPSQAIRHVVAIQYIARVATQDDMESMLISGHKVEDYSAEPAGEAGSDAQ